MSGDHVKVSKFLSLVLRHQPDTIGLTLDANGWADVEELIRLVNTSGRTLTRPLLDRVVAENDKKRFAFSDDGTRIRPLLAAGEAWTDDTAKCPYGAFTNVRGAPTHGGFAVTYRLVKPFDRPEFFPNPRYKAGPTFHHAVDPAFYRDRLEIGVRTHFPAEATDRHLYLADTPSLIRTGLGGSTLTETLKRPSLLARREGAEGLASVFVVVHEPYYGKPKVASVERLNCEGQAVALSIKRANGTDTVPLALDGAATVRTDAATMTGRVALASNPREGKPVAFLVGGTELRAGETRVSAPAAEYSAFIRSVESKWLGASANAIVTEAPLLAGTHCGDRGRWSPSATAESRRRSRSSVSRRTEST
jgi:hypothetical protein